MMNFHAKLFALLIAFCWGFFAIPCFAAEINVEGKHHSEVNDYLLGAGDLVRISVYGNPDMLTEARISSAGTIHFPLIGEIKLGGLSSVQAENEISKSLEINGILKNPQLNVVVAQFGSKYITVLGDVYKAGRYIIERPSRVSDLLAMAGGVSQNGSDIIKLLRNKDGLMSQKIIDIRDFTSKMSADVNDVNPSVYEGDVIFVQGRDVSVVGKVNRPGKYPLSSNVRRLSDFISLAGGVTSEGSKSVTVTMERNGAITTQIINLDSLFELSDKNLDIELAPGDRVYIPEAPVFYIYGEVQRPGTYKIEPGMMIIQGLAQGGGPTQRGSQRNIKLFRRDDKGDVKKINTELTDLIKKNDVIYIQESLF